MSASLVGSEMCIRDRRHPILRTAAGCFRLPPVSSVRPAARGLARTGTQACLLYTSDAADDM
eukprot:14380336-Alexandrium_andersonii.AAC.1